MNDLRLWLCASLLLGPAAHAAPAEPQQQLHFGYYQEDAASDAVDPLTGIVTLQRRGNRLTGALLYALHGCRAGADEAVIDAAVAASALSGSWQGSIDGQEVSGSFQGLIGGDGSFHGSYTGARGLTGIDCNGDGRREYTIAALGQWRSWPLGGGSLPLQAVAGGLGWPDRAARYWLQLYDADCLTRGGGLADCLRLDDDRLQPHFSAATAAAVLERGRNYILVVLALEEFGDTVIGFGSRRFRY
jgi:hypothetical protein